MTVQERVEKQSDVATALAEKISDAMNQKGLSIRDMAERLDLTYEHVRRIAKGEGIPSNPVLRLIAQELRMDFKELQRLSTEARIIKKFGSIPAEISGHKPGLEPIERAWDNLTEEQKADAISLITGWSRRNRAAKT